MKAARRSTQKDKPCHVFPFTVHLDLKVALPPSGWGWVGTLEGSSCALCFLLAAQPLWAGAIFHFSSDFSFFFVSSLFLIPFFLLIYLPLLSFSLNLIFVVVM